MGPRNQDIHGGKIKKKIVLNREAIIMMSLKDRLIKNIPWLLVGISFFYIILMLTLSYMIDIHKINIFGLRSWITNTFPNPYFWFLVFDEASITEHIQWLYLIGILGITISYILINHRELTKKTALPWFLLFLGVYLMFLEDRFNIRHMGSFIISSRIFAIDITSADWPTSILRTTIELFFYLILGSAMISALLLIIKNNKNQSQGLKFLLMGYILYGTAAFASATRNIGNWYAVVGTKILELIISGKELSWSAISTPTFSWKPLGFYFMDFVIEESIELMGATFLLAAVLIYLPLSKFYEE